MNFTETDEQQAPRAAVAGLGGRYRHSHFLKQARTGGRLTQLRQYVAQHWIGPPKSCLASG